MPGFNPMDVTTKRVLKKLGGDMRRYSITFDGDTTGLRTYTSPETGLSYVGLLKNYVDPDELVTITVSIGGDTVKFNKADWRLNQSADDDYSVIVNYQEQGVPIASSGPTYFDVIADPNYNAYVSRIEFAETVIVPIDQKYLPGVCLPVVELSTEPNYEGVKLTAEESAALDKAVGLPCIIKCRVIGQTIAALYNYSDPEGLPVFMFIFSSIAVNINKSNNGSWYALLVEI